MWNFYFDCSFESFEYHVANGKGVLSFRKRIVKIHTYADKFYLRLNPLWFLEDCTLETYRTIISRHFIKL